MASRADTPAPDPDEPSTAPDADPAVSTIPLDTEDGGTVVITQQNMGGDRQAGGGEFKDGTLHKSPEEADAEQQQLAREAPIDSDVQT